MQSEHPQGYIIEPLSEEYKRNDFCCGIPELDRYFYEQIGQDKRKRLCAPFVLFKKDTMEIAGYYTLSATAINLGELPKEIRVTIQAGERNLNSF